MTPDTIRDRLREGIERTVRAFPSARPELTETSKRLADEAAAGRLEGIDIGRRDIDWNGLHWHHQEWYHRLNRFFQLDHLAVAYQQTGDEIYAEAARDYIADWIAQHPPQKNWQPHKGVYACDSNLNLSIRLGNGIRGGWLGTMWAFLDSSCYDEVLLEKIVFSARAQLDWLRANVPLGGNPRVVAATCLTLNSLRLFFLPEAERWRQAGVDTINDCFRRLCLPDGAHVERDTHYCNWMKGLYEQFWRAARREPELGIRIDTERLARMHDFAVAARKPSGAENSLHDGNGEWTGSHDIGLIADRAAFRKEAGLSGQMPPLSAFFPHAGQAFLRTDWSEQATWLSFDASTGAGGHHHLSRNAIQLHAFGRTLLTDPGSINYDMSDPAMFYGRSTRAHCTACVNGWNQFQSEPDWTVFHTTAGCDMVASRYSGGYWPGRLGWWYDQALGAGFAAVHTRMLVWLKPDAVAIIDNFCRHDEEERGEHEPPSLEINWKFAPGNAGFDPHARRAWSEYDDANVLLLFPLMPDNLTMHLHVGETDPHRGWVGSPERGGRQEHPTAPLLTLESNPWKDFMPTYVSVLLPYVGTRAPEVSANVTPPTNRVSPWRLDLFWGDGRNDSLYWMGYDSAGVTRMIGELPEMATDASVLMMRHTANGETVAACALDGTWWRRGAALRAPACFDVEMVS